MPYSTRVKTLTLMSAVWVMCLVTWISYKVFTSPPDIPGGTAAAYATALGLPALVIGWFRWARGDKEK